MPHGTPRVRSLSHGYWHDEDRVSELTEILKELGVPPERMRRLKSATRARIESWIAPEKLSIRLRSILDAGFAGGGSYFDDMEIARIDFRPLPAYPDYGPPRLRLLARRWNGKILYRTEWLGILPQVLATLL